MSLYRKIFGNKNNTDVFYPGESVIVKLNTHIKKAVIDITIRPTKENGNDENKYVGHIYNKGKRYDIVFFQSNICSDEEYEQERFISINLDYINRLSDDDE